MAEPIRAIPKIDRPPQETAREELDALLETLHASGALRILQGLVGRLGSIAEVVLDRLDSRGGRDALANLAIAAENALALEPEGFERFARGLSRGLSRAPDPADHEAPSVWRLWRLANEPDTRRGALALLIVLRTLGASLREPPTR
jgi:hypothetical protein